MRIKPDSSLDEVWKASAPSSSSPPPAETVEQMHEAVIVGLMRDNGLSREEAEEAAENFF
jgi:hypothetical protein